MGRRRGAVPPGRRSPDGGARCGQPAGGCAVTSRGAFNGGARRRRGAAAAAALGRAALDWVGTACCCEHELCTGRWAQPCEHPRGPTRSRWSNGWSRWARQRSEFTAAPVAVGALRCRWRWRWNAAFRLRHQPRRLPLGLYPIPYPSHCLPRTLLLLFLTPPPPYFSTALTTPQLYLTAAPYIPRSLPPCSSTPLRHRPPHPSLSVQSPSHSQMLLYTLYPTAPPLTLCGALSNLCYVFTPLPNTPPRLTTAILYSTHSEALLYPSTPTHRHTTHSY